MMDWLLTLRTFLQTPLAQQRDPDETMRRILIAIMRWSGGLAPTASDPHDHHAIYAAVRFAMLRILEALQSDDPAIAGATTIVLTDAAQTALITMETADPLTSTLDRAALIETVLNGVLTP